MRIKQHLCFVGADLRVCPNAVMMRLAQFPYPATEMENCGHLALGRHIGLPLQKF
jgi:hypothetical protein